MEPIEDRIVAWQREAPELSTRAFVTCLRAIELGAVADRFRQRVLEPFELSLSEYETLASLRLAGPPYRVNASLLAGRVGLSSGGMTKVLKKLETAGLVAREADPDDGRGIRVVLRRRGLDLQTRVLQAFAAAAARCFEGLPEAGLRESEAHLERLTSRLGALA